MDAVAATVVDKGIIVVFVSAEVVVLQEVVQKVCGQSVILVHLNTSQYIIMPQDILRLGQFYNVYLHDILLTFSQIPSIYISRHPHPPPSRKA
jgi:hypothetical protein